MKFLENKKLKLESEPGKKAHYSDLIIECLNHMPQDGFSRQDYQERDRIEKAMNKFKNGNFKFEDQDAKNLQKIVALMRWKVREDEINTFLDAVAEMKQVTNTK